MTHWSTENRIGIKTRKIFSLSFKNVPNSSHQRTPINSVQSIKFERRLSPKVFNRTHLDCDVTQFKDNKFTHTAD